ERDQPDDAHDAPLVEFLAHGHHWPSRDAIVGHRTREQGVCRTGAIAVLNHDTRLLGRHILMAANAAGSRRRLLIRQARVATRAGGGIVGPRSGRTPWRARCTSR